MEDKINQFSRTEALISKRGVELLRKSRIAVFGIGGVGGYAAEAAARAGIGNIDVIDADTVSLTNLNRQIIALHSTIGQYKADVMRQRILDINPSAKVGAYKIFYDETTKDMFDLGSYDCIIDAIDTVSSKLLLITQADSAGTWTISSMGTGRKLDPTAFEVSDIYRTSVCPLARVMRRELKKRGIKNLKVVYSKEEPRENASVINEKKGNGAALASISFVPPAAGLIIAGETIKHILNKNF